MPLKTITTTTITWNAAPGPCYYATHANGAVKQRGYKATGEISSPSALIAADTAAEVDAEIARLCLTPLPLTPRQQAKAYFFGLPPEVQQAFSPVLEAVSVIQSDAEAIRAVEAVTVPETLVTIKANILAKMRGQ